MKLSVQDKKELERFVKFLVHKCVQIIVQSRLGESQKTWCKPQPSGSDWFNLNVSDISEITSEVKRILGQSPHKSLGSGSPICVELSLRTPEGESMVLEVWELALLAEGDSSVKMVYTVYNRMSLLMKSLVAVTRVVPAYRLALTQNPDTFILHYRLYIGPMHDECCGDNSKVVNIGQVGMPHATVSLSVRYRTKLVLGNKEKHNTGLMVKSDYFSPTQVRIEDSNPLKDLAANREFNLEYPSKTLPSPRSNHSNGLNQCSPFGAFAGDPPPMPVPEDLSDMFCALLLDPEETIPIDEEVVEEKEDDDDWRKNDREESMRNSKEHYVYVDLKPAFAEHSSDLGIFFTGVPPALKSLNGDCGDENQPNGGGTTLQEQVEQLKTHLENLQEIDKFLQDVCGAEG